MIELTVCLYLPLRRLPTRRARKTQRDKKGKKGKKGKRGKRTMASDGSK